MYLDANGEIVSIVKSIVLDTIMTARAASTAAVIGVQEMPNATTLTYISSQMKIRHPVRIN